MRGLARRVLQGLGYAVLEARDGDEALALAGSHAGPLDLLVTDVVMPRLGGRQLRAALAGRFPALRVLYLSGHTDDAVLRHGVAEEEAAFLRKPFTPAALAHAVRAALDGAGARGP